MSSRHARAVILSLALVAVPDVASGQGLKGMLESQMAEQAKRRQEKAAWLKTQNLDAYEQVGRKNPKWDEAARTALQAGARLWSVERPNPDDQEIMAAALNKAVRANCNDPYIRYLHTRYVYGAPQGGGWITVAADMKQAKYPPRARLYAFVWAAFHVANITDPSPTFRKQALQYWDDALEILPLLVKDKSPHLWSDKNELYYFMMDVGKTLHGDRKVSYDRMVAKLGNAPGDQLDLLVLRGMFYVNYAWDARGRGTAGNVTAEGWQQMKARLAEAEKALEDAWKLDPRNAQVPTLMLTVELGQGRGRDRMELWFNRAFQNGAGPAAIDMKMEYLEPKWYGSEKDLLDFGRQCQASKDWVELTPFHLADAHQRLAKYLGEENDWLYYRKPGVWMDLQTVYDGYLAYRPDAAYSRFKYAQAAVRCNQGKAALQQLGLIKDQYAQFASSSKNEYEELVEAARKLGK